MIDTDEDVSEKYEGLIDAEGYIDYDGLDHLLTEVKRLREENKVLAKYREIVTKYDDALLTDGDEDPRWSELYD